MCTITTAAVVGVSAAVTVSTLSAIVAASTSANTGRAPAAIVANAVAAKVLAGTTTSRPATSNARSTISIAAVPLVTATAYGT